MECNDCFLHVSRKNIIHGEGTGINKIMLIFEAPSYYEDKLNELLVGKARDNLLDILGDNNFYFDDFYITYMVKCKTPRNRAPTNHEISICKKHLIEEIKEYNPKIIITFGTSLKLFNTINNFSSKINKPFYFNDIIIIPTYPIKFIINDKYKQKIKETFKILSNGIRN